MARTIIRAALVVVYGILGAAALVHYLTPCDVGHLCALAVLPGSLGQRWRRWVQARITPPPSSPHRAQQGAAEIAAHLTQLRVPVTVTQVARAAWADGYASAERPAYVAGWWAGARTGAAVGLYLGTPLVLLGYWAGRWVLAALGVL